MKERIAEAATRLVREKNVKKLTVTEIVAECQITRQTFYYHFEDVPALLRWMLERESQSILKKTLEQGTAEESLRYFFQMAIHTAPYIRKGMQTNYDREIQTLLTDFFHRFFTEIAEREDLYADYTLRDQKLFVRYHSCAVMGMLQEWTEDDTQNLDEIVHKMMQLMTGKIHS